MWGGVGKKSEERKREGEGVIRMSDEKERMEKKEDAELSFKK